MFRRGFCKFGQATVFFLKWLNTTTAAATSTITTHTTSIITYETAAKLLWQLQMNDEKYKIKTYLLSSNIFPHDYSLSSDRPNNNNNNNEFV